MFLGAVPWQQDPVDTSWSLMSWGKSGLWNISILVNLPEGLVTEVPTISLKQKHVRIEVCDSQWQVSWQFILSFTKFPKCAGFFCGSLKAIPV